MSICDDCMNLYYDEEYDCYTCNFELDEDEMSRMLNGHFNECPHYRRGDDYTIVRKQN